MAKVSEMTIRDVPLYEIDPPEDVDRATIDSVEVHTLAESIKEIGLLQGILVRPVGGRFQIVLGHRRFLACKALELHDIRAEIREMDDKEAALARATENLARVDLTPLEEARIYGNLRHKHEMTLEEISRRMGRGIGTIKHRMDILRMPEVLQEAIHRKQISMTVAEELWQISDQPSLEYYLLFAVDNGCTKEVARGWAKEWKDSKRREASAGVQSTCVSNPYEPKPIYISCDLCQGPVELGKDCQLRICDECMNTIKKNM